jgi:MtN3 and saliva related transmembrane protein
VAAILRGKPHAIRLSLATRRSVAHHHPAVADHGPRLIAALGYLAAACSTLSFAPQAWKIIRSRQTRDISLGMYLLTVCGFALWLAYGIALRQWPLMIANGICLALAGFILGMKLLPAAKRDAVADAIAPD